MKNFILAIFALCLMIAPLLAFRSRTRTKSRARVHSKAGPGDSNPEEEGEQLGDGYVFYYEMPRDDDALCDINFVKWNRPFVKVFIKDNMGQGADKIIVEDKGTRRLYDFIKEKREKEKAEKEKAENRNNEGQTEGAKEGEDAKKKEEEERGMARFEIANLPFWKITKFRRVSTSRRKGVCINYMGFMEDLAHLDPHADQEKKGNDFAIENCIIIEHDSGSGRTLICHSQSSKLAKDILQFLTDEVASITNNCEFLARHLRIQRDRFGNTVKELKAALKRRF